MGLLDQFKLENKVVVITGGAGMLGVEHAVTVAELGGIPVLWDVDIARLKTAKMQLEADWPVRCHIEQIDITDPDAVEMGAERASAIAGPPWALINNAANNPKAEPGSDLSKGRFEAFERTMWDEDIAVGLTGAMLCSQALGRRMANAGRGVILNIASDLSLIAPDQRLYRKEGVSEDQQPVKPVTYSVVKHGLVGLTRYLATYWAAVNVRCNAIAPGGVKTNQDEEFLDRITQLIPLRRMACKGEYKAAVAYLISDASAYMTGAVMSVDGGRTIW